VVSTEAETAHNLEHSIANAALPNIARVEAGPSEGPALTRLLRRVDVIVCSPSAAKRVQRVAGPTMPVILADRALNQRAIQMLATILARQEDDRLTALPTRTRGPGARRAVRPAPAQPHPGGNGQAAGQPTEP
jgi:hypothetical protein